MLKIGYSPNSNDLCHPADRRRIVYWAKKRGHEIILDLEKKHDVLVLSGRADFSKYNKTEQQTPRILDLVDGYLGPEKFYKDFLRGFGKVITGQLSGPLKSYSEVIRISCQNASAVICETAEQALTIKPYCKNVFPILDFHEEFPFLEFKDRFTGKKSFNLLWEGLPYTINGLDLISKSLDIKQKSFELHLNAVTDLNFKFILGNFFNKKTSAKLKNVNSTFGRNFQLIEWNIPNLIAAAKKSDLAILPLDPSGTLNPLKAENRLLIMWRLGLPTLTSHSKAYERVMKDIDFQGICYTQDDWKNKIIECTESTDLRKSAVEKGQQYIREKHSEKLLLEAWDKAIESIL